MSAQYAADILPRLIFLACLALKEALRALSALVSLLAALPSPLTPCCPKRINLIVSPSFANTAWDLVGCPGVRLGLLYPLKVSSPRETSFE